MSRFKFRVWDKTNKKFVAEYKDSPLYLSLDGKTLLADFPEYGCPIDSTHFEWEIQQCTGLKDSEGNLIFEGDYLRRESEIIKYHIVWSDAEACFYGEAEDKEDILLLKTNPDYKIIGNIFEGKQ